MSTPQRRRGGSMVSKARHNPYGRRSSSSGCFSPFRSPSVDVSKIGVNKSTPSLTDDDKLKLAQEVVNLKEREDEMDQQIMDLRKRYSSEDLQTYIDKLHEYNEMKDVGQILLGKLAEVEGTTTRQLYERFDLDLED